MKKRVTVAAFACMIAFSPLYTPAADAAGISVGMASWYAYWEIEPANGLDFDPALLYGPVLGVDFAERWALTSVFLTGYYDVVPEASPFEFRYRRYDSDTALNYSLNRYFKVFAGFKYMRYDISIIDDGGMGMDFSMKHYSYGPGVGIGLSLPLSDSLFAIANVSGMYLFGKDNRETEDFVEPGVNTALALAWYIAPISTTITAGGRYQYFRSIEKDDDTDFKFYGLTLSAVYNFSLGGPDE
ncbi:MAG: hypothetical protein MUC76_14585 [Spirochaetes bacterium]|nr:hypothetical protein [Spirochaetota bacterium]